MKISIIIPIYNVEKYIERCLNSVLSQSYEDLEIILVNDCSPDGSMNIADRVTEKSPRKDQVKIVNHSKNQGVSTTRNSAIDIATGKYILFLDSDDYIPNEAVSLLASAIQAETEVVIGNYTTVGKNRRTLRLKTGNSQLTTSEQIRSLYTNDGLYVMPWNKLVRKDFILANQLYFEEGMRHEDDLWSYKLFFCANNIAIVNEITYYYYIHPDSITEVLNNSLECRVKIIDIIHEFITSEKTELMNDRWAYISFERLKSKFFDRVLYFSKNEKFRKEAYRKFRSNSLISAGKALFKFRPPLDVVLQNIHYALPLSIGYLYFKLFVKAQYYFLILRIKLGLIS